MSQRAEITNKFKMKKIMFNDKYSLTQAVLNGRKTMTRRISDEEIRSSIFCESGYENIHGYEIKPRYQVGEIVAIAQSYETLFHSGNCPSDFFIDSSTINEKYCGAGFSNKMFVKAENMAFYIEMETINYERLQAISDEDCLKEGIYRLDSANGNGGVAYSFTGASKEKNIGLYPSPREAFSALINKVSGKGTWEYNPFVWAYEFKLSIRPK